MQPWDLNKTGATTRALGAGADSSSDGSCTSDHNSGVKHKRPRDSTASLATDGSGSDHDSGIKKKRSRYPKASHATVVMTDAYSFRAMVDKFTGMPTLPASASTCQESKRPPLLFKPKAQRAEINIPLITMPSQFPVLMNSTYCCNLPSTDHLHRLPLVEGYHPVETRLTNSMLQLPVFSDNKSSNHKSSNRFEEILRELELTVNAAI